MESSIFKKIQKVGYLGIFIAVALFPYGQVPGLVLEKLFLLPITIHPLELFLALGSVCLLVVTSRETRKKIFEAPSGKLLLIFGFTFIFGILSNPQFSLGGISYLVRLGIYLLLLEVLLFQNLKFRKNLLHLLIVSGLVMTFIGYVQYFILPDLRQLKFLGWDDHYLRLAGTLLDPGYMGIVLTLIVLTLLRQDIKLKALYRVAGILFTLPALFLTYSRASYLALFVSLFILFLRFKNVKKFLYIVVPLFVLSVLILPKGEGEGTNLLRVYSGSLRLKNYAETISIGIKNPLFGVGYNNICEARRLYISLNPKMENSCSGADNSFLFLFATTGVAGVLSFLYLVSKYLTRIDKNSVQLMLPSITAISVHSFFSNTLVYPWVLFWMVLAYSTLVKTRSDKSS